MEPIDNMELGKNNEHDENNEPVEYNAENRPQNYCPILQFNMPINNNNVNINIGNTTGISSFI